MSWGLELAGRGRESLFGLYGMRRRRMLGGLCGVVGVSRGPFIVSERKEKSHGRAETASNERAAKMPLSCQLYTFCYWDLMGGNGQALLDNLWPQNTELFGIFKGLIS
jgi:hypothetical protein